MIVAADCVSGSLGSVPTIARSSAQPKGGKWAGPTQRAGEIAALIALCTWIVVGLSLVVSASRWFPVDASYSIALGSFACVLVVAGLTRNTDFRTPHLRATGTFVRHAIIGCLAFLALTAILFDGAQSLISLTLIAALYVPALAEEWIFRVAIPARIRRILSDRDSERSHVVFIAVIAAQATFAASHLMIGADNGVTPRLFDALALFCGGCFLAILVRRVGLWFAATVHASANLQVLSGHFIAIQSISPKHAVLIGLVTVVIARPQLVRNINRACRAFVITARRRST